MEAFEPKPGHCGVTLLERAGRGEAPQSWDGFSPLRSPTAWGHADRGNPLSDRPEPFRPEPGLILAETAPMRPPILLLDG